jgi:hypothetical protein
MELRRTEKYCGVQRNAIGKKAVAIDPGYTFVPVLNVDFKRRKTEMVEPSNARAVASRSMLI